MSSREVRPIVALTLTEGGARLLSFFFYVLAARALSPHGFGRVRYTLTVVLIVFFALQVVVKAIARELGGARGDPVATRRLIGSSVTLTCLLLVLTSGFCAIAGSAGLLGAVDVKGLVVALVGYTSFQAYYAIARGIGETVRPALAYVGGSLVQLIAFGLLSLGGYVTVSVALMTYGLSSIVPIVVCEIWRPVVANHLIPNRGALKRLLVTSSPLIIGQIGFIVWNSADQIWVQFQLGARDVGLYGAARNLSQLFIVIPTGVGVALLPRLAELRARRLPSQARRLALYSTAGVLTVTAILAVVVIVTRGPLLSLLYGSAYRSASPALLLQSIGMVFYAGYATLSVSALGWGWARLSVVGICVGGVTEVLALAVLPGHGLSVAAGAFTVSMGISFGFVLAWCSIRGNEQLQAAMTQDST